MSSSSPSVEPGTRRARVVRANDVSIEPLHPPSRLMRSVQFDAQRDRHEAEEVLANARERAAGIVREAEVDAAALRSAARRRATRLFVRARRRARRRAARETASRLAELETRLIEQRRRYEEDVRDAALRFARAILDVEFQVRPERIVELVRGALLRARAYRRIVVRVPETHREILVSAIAELRERLAGGELHVTADPNLRGGAVLLETEAGTYDASLATQLERLAAYLREEGEEG